MKKWLERLKEKWFGILPLILLLGIPSAVGIVIWAICNRDDIPVILGHISDIGNGSLIYGIIIALFSLIGLVNAFAAFMMWFKAFSEWLERKAKSHFWFWLAIIIVTFGWYAIFKIIKTL